MMTSRDPQVCREFVARTKEVLARLPTLSHTWSIDADKDHCILNFPASSAEGFPIVVEVFPEMITVSARGFHQHFDVPGDVPVLIEEALGLVRDLLSPAMRIRECRAGNSPYRWICESRRAGKWWSEGSTSLMFWNYFGRRSERIYRNHSLPERKAEGSQSLQRSADSRPLSDDS